MACKILIVDDSQTDQLALKEAVTPVSSEVLIASSGAEAIDIAVAECPDIILLDIVMGDMSGYDTCRALRMQKCTAQTPIIFVSSKSSKADKFWAMKQGGNALIGKPYDKQEILDQLHNFGF